MKHNDWFTRITRGDSLRRVAEQADISDRTLSRQLRAGELDPALIIKISEAYEESPVVALVDLGFMSSKWITVSGVVTDLGRASDEELTDELLRRLRLLEDKPVDELAERRNSNTSPIRVAPMSDDEIADAIREANEQPQAAHPADNTEYTEPDHP